LRLSLERFSGRDGALGREARTIVADEHKASQPSPERAAA